MKSLQLPPTIRTPHLREVPADLKIIQRLEDRKNANIVPGYLIRPNTSNVNAYNFFAEINIDNDDLWLLFTDVLLQMPREVSLIYGAIEEEPSFSVYMDRDMLLKKIEPFKQELTLDGFLEFGAIFHTATYFEEIFVKKAKYIQYWGMDENRFKQLMVKHGLTEVSGLNFIDEYPLVTEALNIHVPGARYTGVVLEQLTEALKE